nr:extracellular solute-binding protein [uncultured Sellimonas sp.]
MKKIKEKEIKGIYIVAILLFLVFLFIPILILFWQSLASEGGVTFAHYKEMLAQKGFGTAIGHSIAVSMTSALVATILAFLLAYTVHYTNTGKTYKKFIRLAAQLPMLLPTITYGFAIIYSFGKQGLLTKLFGRQLFDIYGFNGLVIGYVIYTLPVSFMLLSNTMEYIDKKFMVVSRIMGDSPFKTFWQTVLIPLMGTFATSFVQCFFLCFTDYGIPESVGGKYEVVATVLYNEMLGSIPNFNNGAVVAIIMLIPSVVSILLLKFLERYNIRYNKISVIELKENKVRDGVCSIVSGLILLCVFAVFAVIFIMPFIEEWPYKAQFTLGHFQDVFRDNTLTAVYKNSLFVAIMTAIFGTILTYGCALVSARSNLKEYNKQAINSTALITNTIPGMVIGIAYMLVFSGTSLQNTFLLIIICNMIHYFSTPYLMIKNALLKLNTSWEATAKLLGDSWIKTLMRIVTPNMSSTLLEVFGYYFVNAMVTVSAVIFIAGAKTMVITTKIKELQYFMKFNEIFVLSLLILVTNLCVKGVLFLLSDRKKAEAKITKKEKKTMKMKSVTAMMLVCLMAGSVVLGGCSGKGASASSGSGDDKVIIYSNADEEAVDAMKKTLDENGYKDEYVFQTFGTSELGGKLIAEGKDLEADLVTMSSFYLDSAQEKNNMFKDLTFDHKTLSENDYSKFYAPITKQEGAIIVNTELLKENNLDKPTSIKDLAKEEYKGMLSVTDIKSSSTAWLLIQALVNEYGEDGAKEILSGIYKNAGDNIEDSGSAPLKKVRAGEVAVGFGLRHQAVADKKDGLPIDYVDPTEGNFSLTESVAVLDKEDNKKEEKAMEMAECIIEKGRSELQKTYPLAIYEGEKDSDNKSAYPKVYPEKLTVDLLEKHEAISEEAK